MTKTNNQIIHTWDNVDYDYPSCGGTTGAVYADGRVEINYESNMQGTTTGGSAVWQLHPAALLSITEDVYANYNAYNTWDDILQGDGIAYIAELVGMGNGRLVE
jgi:hypothetical protein